MNSSLIFEEFIHLFAHDNKSLGLYPLFNTRSFFRNLHPIHHLLLSFLSVFFNSYLYCFASSTFSAPYNTPNPCNGCSHIHMAQWHHLQGCHHTHHLISNFEGGYWKVWTFPSFSSLPFLILFPFTFEHIQYLSISWCMRPVATSFCFGLILESILCLTGTIWNSQPSVFSDQIRYLRALLSLLSFGIHLYQFFIFVVSLCSCSPHDHSLGQHDHTSLF